MCLIHEKIERVTPELIDSGISAFVGVPIPGPHTNLGVLYAYSRQKEGFDAWGTVTLLQILAGQAGLAITNARVLEQEETRAQEFELLYNLGKDLSESLKLEDVLDRIAQAILSLIPGERVTALVRVGSKLPFVFVQRGRSMYPDRFQPIILEPRPDGFTTEYIFGRGENFLVEDLAIQPRRHPEILKQGVRSTLGVPITFSGEVVGALYAHNNTPNAFHPEDIQRLKYLATHAGVAIHNAQLFQDAKIRGDLLQAMAEQLRNIRGEKQPEKLRLEIVRLAVELLGGEFGGLCRNRSAVEDLELLVPWGFTPHEDPFLIAYGEGIIGQTAVEAKPQLVNAYAAEDRLLRSERTTALLSTPFLHGTEVEAVLFVGSRSPGRTFESRDQEILELFAEQSAVAWRTSQLLGVDQRRILQLEILHQIGDYIQRGEDLYRIYHVALTGITAGFGLGYNRAVLLLRDEEKRFLVGRMGIGEVELAQARQGWEENREHHLHQFRDYLAALEQGSLKPTQIEEQVRGLRLSCELPTDDPLYQVFKEQHWKVLESPKEIERLSTDFLQAFAPDLPLAIVALRAHDETIGLLVVDNKFTKAPITHDDIDDLKTYANSIAAAIDGKMLLQKTQNAERELRSLFRASSTLLSELERSTILHNVTEEARRVTGAASVSAALIDKNGDVQEMVTVGDLQGANVNEIIRSNGLSMRVVETGEPEKFENAAMERDRVNSIVIKLGIVAGLCVPLEIEGGRIGVMWYHYSQPHEFPRDRTETYRLYANQAVLAWDIARRMDHLKNLIERIDRSHRAAQAAARIAVLGENLQDSLNAIVEATKAVLNCDIVTLYPYDQKKKELGFPPAMVGVLKSDKVLHGGRVREGSIVHIDSRAG